MAMKNYVEVTVFVVIYHFTNFVAGKDEGEKKNVAYNYMD